MKGILVGGGQDAIKLNLTNDEEWKRILRGYTPSNREEAFRNVAWLFRGVQIRSQSLASVPFAILNARGDEIDTSADYRNQVKFWDDPQRMLSQIEASLTVYGYAYLGNLKNRITTKLLRYLLPTSMEPVFDSNGNPIAFKRKISDGGELRLEPEQVVYFWAVDPLQESGHPTISPVTAALSAAGVLRNVDKFAETFFERGAIKATIFGVPSTTPQSEVSRFRAWLNKTFAGGDQANKIEVMNSDEVKATVIGEGLSELANNELTKERREDISTALGVPHSLLFSNAANFATAKQDEINFMQKTIVPEAMFIQQVLNTQLFAPLGLQFEFRFEELQSFQEEEVQRSQAFANLTTTLPPWVAGPILGYDLPADMDWDMLKEESLAWIEQRGKLRAPTSIEDTRDPSEQRAGNEFGNDMRLWQRKAKRRLQEGKSAAVSFVSEHIPPTLQHAILGSLEAVTAASGVQSVFEDAERWSVYP